MKKNKILFATNSVYFFIYLFFLIFGILKSTQSNTILDINENDFVIGNKDAPITIIEYASLSCIHCSNFHQKTLPIILEEYVNTNKVKIIFRDFPLNYPALIGSMLLQCIDLNVRYDYLSALFLLQKNWVKSDPEIVKKELYKIMQSGGMDEEFFNDCINNEDLEQKILQGAIDAQKSFGIGTTPSFLINGTLIEGNKSIKEFKKIIDNLLKNSE